MNGGLLVAWCLGIFFFGHLLEYWPLPFGTNVLIQFVSTTWFFAELIFYIYYRNHLRCMQWYSRIPKHGDHTTPEGRRRVLDRMLEVLSGSTGEVDKQKCEKFLRGWFFNSPLNRIMRGNIHCWLTWALFYKYPAWLSESESRESEALLRHFEARSGFAFEEGFDRDVKCMRLSLDTMKAIHRPAIVYMLAAIANSLARVW